MPTFVRRCSIKSRRHSRRCAAAASTLLDDNMTGHELSPFEQAIGSRPSRGTTSALARAPQDGSRFIGRVESGDDYGELAAALASPAKAPRGNLPCTRALLPWRRRCAVDEDNALLASIAAAAPTVPRELARAESRR